MSSIYNFYDSLSVLQIALLMMLHIGTMLLGLRVMERVLYKVCMNTEKLAISTKAGPFLTTMKVLTFIPVINTLFWFSLIVGIILSDWRELFKKH